MIHVRKPAVAGLFYPEEPDELQRMVRQLLDDAASEAGSEPPRALIVPHAGYVYSGPVAASAYALLEPWREHYRRVVLLGPAHRLPFRGLAGSSADAFRTPLGDVPLESTSPELLLLPFLREVDEAHREEHSLEVQLPFLQTVLESFALLPFVVGEARPEEAATLLEACQGGPETLIVISSDLSHYLPYEQASARDRETCRAIESLEPRLSHYDACGATAVNALLLLARQYGLNVRTLDLRNSGDTAGSREQVVGYGAWAFYGV